MDRGEGDPSKLKKIPTLPDLEKDSECASCSEEGAAASNDKLQTSASSTPKVISEEAAEKSKEDIITRVALMQLLSDSESATYREGGATASNDIPQVSGSTILTKEAVEKSLKEMFPEITSTNLLLEMNEEGFLPPRALNPIPCQATSGGKPKSSRSIQTFLRSKLKHLKNLNDYLHDVNRFMSDVAVEHAGAERHNPNANIPFEISENWSEIFHKWEIARSLLPHAMVRTKQMLDHDRHEFTITDIEEYIDCLSLLQINLHALNVICYKGLNKYRSFCEKFVDYQFMVHISVLPEQTEDLLQQLTFVLDYFGTYYTDSESEDSE